MNQKNAAPMSASDAARYAHLPVKVIAAAMTNGALKWKRIARMRRTTTAWIEEWLARGR